MRPLILAAAIAASFTANAQQSVFSNCLTRETAGASLGTLPKKIVLTTSVRETPFALLADQSKPTEEEKESIAKWADIVGSCAREDEPDRKGRLLPEALSYVDAYLATTVADAASLYTGEISFGQFNKLRIETDQKLRAALAELRQRRADQAQAAAQSDEIARRNAALQYFMGSQGRPSAPQIQPYQTPSRPTLSTNCYRFGNQTTCTTR